jgi:hypothetical protein
MFESWKGSSPIAKSVVVFGVGAGVGFGLCTIGTVADSRIAPVGASMFSLSIAGLAITGLVWLGNRIYKAIRK